MARARRNWTPEEDYALRRAVNQALTQSRPLLWRELAKSVPGRSNKDCRRRWWNSLVAGTTKGPWSEDEDTRLIEAVQRFGFAWSQVAKAVMTRNADQCSSHWSQVLDPGINHCDWTPAEDAQLLHEILTHGTNWATIAVGHTPKRTTLALKNRYSMLRLWTQNSAKRKRTASKDMTAAAPLGADTILVASPAPVRHDARQRPKQSSLAADKTVDMEEDDDDDGTDSGSSGNEDEYDDGPQRNGADSTSLSSAMWSDYFDRADADVVIGLAPPTPPHSRMTPMTTPPIQPRNQPPEAAVTDPALAPAQPPSPFKDMFSVSGNGYPTQPLFGTLARDMAAEYNDVVNSALSHPCQVDALADLGAPKTTCQSLDSSLLFSSNMVSPSASAATLVANGSPPDNIDPGLCSRGGIGGGLGVGGGSGTSRGMQQRNGKNTPLLSYQVTLAMVCTVAQIEAVMTSLEAVGMSVDMKMELKAVARGGGGEE